MLETLESSRPLGHLLLGSLLLQELMIGGLLLSSVLVGQRGLFRNRGGSVAGIITMETCRQRLKGWRIAGWMTANCLPLELGGSKMPLVHAVPPPDGAAASDVACNEADDWLISFCVSQGGTGRLTCCRDHEFAVPVASTKSQHHTAGH
jgi:hypothetical protein